ncbi:MAG: hypothetical protein KKG70_01705 [Proteobacteria bacterium]|nr:hypothetical protein [Pseudomonadota bacterium]
MFLWIEHSLNYCLKTGVHYSLPGEGISWFIQDLADYKKLSKKQRRLVIDAELARIYSFSMWGKVLKEFRLKPVRQDFTNFNKIAIAGGGGGGESEEHKNLKKYVLSNPHTLGLPRNIPLGEVEFILPSGDILDVYFQNKKEHIGIEVKSTLSDVADLTRGLYQCIKYQAVLEARQAAMGISQNVRTMLVLGGQLPAELLALKNVLGVQVFENIGQKVVNNQCAS